MKKSSTILSVSIAVICLLIQFPIVVWADTWLWPVPSSHTMSRGYGYDEYGNFHEGIDIVGELDAPIVAAKDGTVCRVVHGDIPNVYVDGGNAVVIDHGNGLYSHYAHLNSTAVSEGQYVNAGTVIGYMGQTGNATGVHLHFAIANNSLGGGGRINTNTDQINYVEGGPIIDGHAPANLGDHFYAYIRHQNKNVYLTQESGSIYGRSFNGNTDQIWSFYRQSNGAYAIFNVSNNGCIDILAASTEGGATVYTYTGGFEGLSNQEFYIYAMYGAYYFSPVHSNGNNMLDMSENTFKLELWGRGEDWSPQEFDIFIIPSVNGQYPANVGTDFYAYIRHMGKNVYFTNQIANIAGEPYTGDPTQVWYFRRMPNGSYVIENDFNGACVDVLAASTTGGGNVYAYAGGYENLSNQRFFIYRMFGGYYFSPEHSNGSVMLDMNENTDNLEIWGSAQTEWSPQQFMIDLVKYSVKYDANGGENTPALQYKNHKQDISLSSNIPLREGYVFKGWAEASNTTEPLYQPGDTYSKDANITLYAVWEKSGMTIDADHFPDDTFRDYIADNCDRDGDGILTEDEIFSVTSINVSFNNVSSLEGIDFFSNLVLLNCNNCQLNSLDVSQLSALEDLYCDHNQLTSLDVTHNLALKSLSCEFNQLASLDLRMNHALNLLNCSGNMFPIASNPFDLSTLSGGFDITKASGWQGGFVNGTVLTATDTAVTYNYDCGNGYTAAFELEAAEPIELSVFVLPSSIQYIEEEAFAGITAEKVVIPATCRFIGSRAFANCPNLKIISFESGGNNTEVSSDFLENSGSPIIDAPDGCIIWK